MATVSCACCRTEISAECRLCYECSGRPPLPVGSFLIQYPTESYAGCHHYERRTEYSVAVGAADG